MKKGLRNTILLFIATILMFSKARAQSSFYEETKRTFYGGIVAGLNFCTIDNDNFSQYNKVGFTGGGIVYARFTEHLMGSMEILYSQKGRTTANELVATGIPGTVFTSIHINLNYVEVPIMINYFDKQKNNFGVGVSYGRLVSSSESYTTDPPVYLTGNDPFNNDDIELLAGGQLHLWEGFYLSLRFQFSIIQIRNTVPTGFYPTEQNNNLWSLRLLYMFK